MSRITEFNTHTRNLAIKFVTRGSLQAVNELKIILGPKGGKRTGRIYKRGRNTHQASAEGESPAVDTGRLRQSATHENPRVEGTKVVGGAGVSAPYAVALEMGTESMAPRPFINRLNDEPHKGKIETAARGVFR